MSDDKTVDCCCDQKPLQGDDGRWYRAIDAGCQKHGLEAMALQKQVTVEKFLQNARATAHGHGWVIREAD